MTSTTTATKSGGGTSYWKKFIVPWTPATALLGVYLFSVILLVLRPEPTSWTHLGLIENPDEGRPPPWTKGVSTFPNPNASRWRMTHLSSTTTLVTRESHLHLWNRFLSRRLSQERQKQGQGNTSTIISSNYPEASSSCSFSPTKNQSALDCRNITSSGIDNTTNDNGSKHNIATIVVQLRGEMANHLSAIAHGRAIQLYALESFGMETQLVFVPQELQLDQQPPPPRQDDPTTYTTTTTSSTLRSSSTILSPKGTDARETLHQCFPILQSWNTRFMARAVGEYGANKYDTRRHRLSHGTLIYPELFHRRQAQQLEWLQQQVVVSSSSLSLLNISSTTLLLTNWTPPRILKVLDRINGRTNPPKGWIKPIVSQDLKQPVQESDMEASLTLFQDLWRLRHDRPKSNTTTTTTTTTTTGTNDIFSTRSLSSSVTETRPIPLISSPFLYSDSLDNFWFIDRYYDEFRQIFSFWSSTPTTPDPYGEESYPVNNPCCREVPYPDESVFHFRNYESELINLAKVLGYKDVTPNQTATILFGHLQPGNRVAIATRSIYPQYSNTKSDDANENDAAGTTTTTSTNKNNLLEDHVKALQDRGIQVRVITGQSGMQDFCFLAHAQNELIGNVRSTYALWAAILGNAKVAKLYTVDSPGLRARFGHGHPWLYPTNRDRFQFPWTHPELKRRIQFELIQ